MLPPGELPVLYVPLVGVRDLSRELGPPAEYGRVPSEATVYSGVGVAMLDLALSYVPEGDEDSGTVMKSLREGADVGRLRAPGD